MGADTAKDIAAFDLTPVLNTPEDIAAWADHGRATGGAAAILSLDTGMRRLGLSPAGIFLGPDFHYDLSRPGAALYGVSRSTGAPKKMKQAVGLKGKILQIRVVDSESTVGYGATQSVPAGSRLATVAAGYADGYLRSLGNRGHGYAAGVKVPVVGRVSMDLVTFDISAVPPHAIGTGDDIDMICEQHTIDDLADEAGTIGYEILTALGQRYARTYTGGGVPAGGDRS